MLQTGRTLQRPERVTTVVGSEEGCGCVQSEQKWRAVSAARLHEVRFWSVLTWASHYNPLCLSPASVASLPGLDMRIN